ncbi:MAG: GGDEF domain-containing protein [Sphingobium sp.]|nr:GGDEF domain-containing protein [Sphingobium sp.]
MMVASVILSLLFGTSLIMTVAMGVAWLHFGRQRHVLTWTASYAVSILQWIANAGAYFLHSRLLYTLTGIGLVVSASLLAIGIRQRSGRPMPVALLGISAAMAITATALSISPWGSQAMQGMIIPIYVGVLIAISAASLWPRDRRLTAPETAFLAILILYACGQVALAFSASLIRGPEEGKEVYRAILGLFMPAIYVGTGVAAVLVVAGDLAQQLRRQVSHDPMTGILNRGGLEEAAERAIANAQRHKRPLSIVVCDLDGFKALNDTHGHIAGDTALRAFAQLLISAVRRGDVVGRMGGDEFGVLLVDTLADSAAEVMERVRSETQHLSLKQAPDAVVSASFGIAQMQEGDEGLDDLVSRADAALYAAKKGGRDRVSIWREAA